jgi:hypothetical protein
MVQFDTNLLFLELQHTDFLSQPDNNNNRNNKIIRPDYSSEQN